MLGRWLLQGRWSRMDRRRVKERPPSVTESSKQALAPTSDLFLFEVFIPALYANSMLCLFFQNNCMKLCQACSIMAVKRSLRALFTSVSKRQNKDHCPLLVCRLVFVDEAFNYDTRHKPELQDHGIVKLLYTYGWCRVRASKRRQ